MNGVGSLLEGHRVAAAQDFLATAHPVNEDNAKLHFYAGELYRKHGDYEAAIRIHKHLLNHHVLAETTRDRAKFELGLDYQQGGFLDLARQCFSDLGSSKFADESVRHLFNIHLLSRDWQQAIADEARFTSKDSDPELRRNVIAQLYCEWAQEETESASSLKLLDTALEHNPSCGRAWLMKAEIAYAADDLNRALSCLAPLRSRPDMLPLAAGVLMRVHAAVGTLDSGEKLLSEELEHHPSELLFAKAYEALAQVKPVAELGDFTKLGMRLLQGTLPVTKWLETQRANSDGNQREMCELILRTLGSQQTLYHCQNCAFSAPSHYWQCPACRTWETMSAVPANRERH